MARNICVFAVLVVTSLQSVHGAEIDDLIARAEKTPRIADKLNPPRSVYNDAGDLIALNLDYVTLTSSDLELVAQCSSLESLSLTHTNIVDGQLKLLGHFHRLRSLSLNHTQVSDAGLEQISRIKTLKSVCLGGVAATPDAVRKLRETIPNLKVGYFRNPRATDD